MLRLEPQINPPPSCIKMAFNPNSWPLGVNNMTPGMHGGGLRAISPEGERVVRCSFRLPSAPLPTSLFCSLSKLTLHPAPPRSTLHPERQRMGAALNKKLGPEFLTSRQAGGGTKVNYIEGWRAISIANEVFGFDGWSTEVRSIDIDFVSGPGRLSSPAVLYGGLDGQRGLFQSATVVEGSDANARPRMSALPSLPLLLAKQVDYNEESHRWSAAVSATVRVTIFTGTYHEDVGIGKMENAKSKGDLMDKVSSD